MHRFYRLACPAEGGEPVAPLAEAGSWQEIWWEPGRFSLGPPGGYPARFLVWWAFHRLNVFYNPDYSTYLIFDGRLLVHRSCVFPGFFRFTFMAPEDLQVGDTWTHPDYRGRGLATHALRIITRRKARPGRTFWYLVEADNRASIRTVEKAGFTWAGSGHKQPRFGLRMLGYYRMDEKAYSMTGSES